MRERLRKFKERLSIQDSIRELRGQVEYILWYIGTIPSAIPSVTGGSGGSSFSVPTVEELPAIPTDPETFSQVFWTSAGAGTGDDQVWHTYTGMTRWYPTLPTTKSGAPGA